MRPARPGPLARKRLGTDYDRVASLYDLLSGLYSLGAIAEAKRAHLPLLQAGERVVYLGAGSCQEGALASLKGADVTVLDASRAMLGRAQRAFDRRGTKGRFVWEDVWHFRPGPRFDHAVFPFFLNVFAPNDVLRIAERTTACLASTRRRITVADFRAPQSGLFCALQRLHYLPPLLLFRLLTGNAWHELYDYPKLLAPLGLRLIERRVVPVLGLPLYESLTFEAPS